MIRFHLDQNVNHAIALGLRIRDIDVTTTTDAGLQDAQDEQHIAFALIHRRVIFTHDEDFLAQHSRGAEHSGIAYCEQGARTIGEVIRHLYLVPHGLSAEEMKGRNEYI